MHLALEVLAMATRLHDSVACANDRQFRQVDGSP
jgi:hypothetical protein